MLTNETKKQIIEAEISALERQEYQLELQCKVFKKTEQSDQLEVRSQMLKNTLEQKDFYIAELEKLKKGD